MESTWIMGLMSGTSLDGIDAALIKTDGETVSEFGPGFTYLYEEDFRDKLRTLLYNPCSSELRQIENELTELHCQVISNLITESGIKPSLIGFHGQTIYHCPRSDSQPAKTIQIGNGQCMADTLGINVIYDFRQNDVQNGGEGAPLVPIYHLALAKNLPKPLAIVNIGGVSNATLIDENAEILAGDTGPGNALIDDWAKEKLGLSYDKKGMGARSGQIHDDLLNRWLEHPFFKRPFPKSLDRNSFSFCLHECSSLTPEDGLATLTAFTAHSIFKSVTNSQTIIITGGGRHNLFLLDLLKKNFTVQTTEDIGLQGDLLEAQAFAFLAARSQRNLPLSFPTTTGVLKPTLGGKLCFPHLYKTASNSLV